jgi:hypothetical protein
MLVINNIYDKHNIYKLSQITNIVYLLKESMVIIQGNLI